MSQLFCIILAVCPADLLDSPFRYFVWAIFFIIIAIAVTLLKYKNMEQDADLKSSSSRLLGDYLRNKEALNSTWNRIYSLKIFHVVLYCQSSILQGIWFLCCIPWFVPELINGPGGGQWCFRFVSFSTEMFVCCCYCYCYAPSPPPPRKL